MKMPNMISERATPRSIYLLHSQRCFVCRHAGKIRAAYEHQDLFDHLRHDLGRHQYESDQD